MSIQIKPRAECILAYIYLTLILEDTWHRLRRSLDNVSAIIDDECLKVLSQMIRQVLFCRVTGREHRKMGPMTKIFLIHDLAHGKTSWMISIVRCFLFIRTVTNLCLAWCTARIRIGLVVLYLSRVYVPHMIIEFWINSELWNRKSSRGV